MKGQKIKNQCTLKQVTVSTPISTVLLGNRVSCFRCDQLSWWINSTLILSKRVVQNVFAVRI